jgi:ribosomal-protein-alanine N-acetyltransferase
MTLRAMRWWDLEEVVELERELFPDDPWSPEQFWGELAHVPETRWYAVHTDDAGIDAYVGVFAIPPDADLQTIAVAPRAQGRGLGRELLDRAIAEARHRGCSQVMLEVAHDNEPAIALYASVGFESLGRRRDYYGPGLDAVIMRLRLTGEAS